MKPMKLLIASCIASSVFTFYSAIQSGVYYNKFINDTYYSNQPKFAEVSNLVEDAEKLIAYNKNVLAGIYLQRAEHKFINISPEQNLGKFSAIDDFLKEVSTDLQKPNNDSEYQLFKLNMVQNELDSIRKNYLSQSNASKNLNELAHNFRNTMYSLVPSALLLMLCCRKRKQTIK